MKVRVGWVPIATIDGDQRVRDIWQFVRDFVEGKVEAVGPVKL